MTQDMTEKDTSSSKRYTVPEAAKLLGIGTDAVRKRIARGTIPYERDDKGRVYVYLDAGHDDGHDERHEAEHSDAALVESLREQIGYLQGVIATRDEELRTRAEELRRRDRDLERRDHIIAALTERLPQPIPPPSEQPPEAPETVEEEPERAQPRSDTVSPQTPPQRQEPVEEERAEAEEPRQPVKVGAWGGTQSSQRITLRGLRRRILGW
jgi:excisionase family DNA binding protein